MPLGDEPRPPRNASSGPSAQSGAHANRARAPRRYPTAPAAIPRSAAAVKAFSTISGMAVNAIRLPRNACTATSLAAFSTVALPAPCRMAAMARPSAGKRSTSGRSKVELAERGKIERRGRELRAGPANRGSSRSAAACRPARSPHAIEPSRKVISACTTDCGCTSTSSRSGAMAKRWWASISSRPLFMSVAESMEILAPIDQVGWASACAGVAFAMRSAGQVAERPARGRQRIGADRRRVAALEQLEERIVLRIDRQDAHVVLARELHEARCRRRSGIPCWRARCCCRIGWPPPSPSGRRRRRLPRGRCRPARRPPPPARRARRRPRCPLPNSASRKAGSPSSSASTARRAPSLRAVSASLRAVRMRCDGVNLETVGIGRDHVGCARPDRPGRAEQRDAIAHAALSGEGGDVRRQGQHAVAKAEAGDQPGERGRGKEPVHPVEHAAVTGNDRGPNPSRRTAA